MARIKPVSHEDRLTLVEHLDELRTRIIISVLAFAVGFGLCFWQNDADLRHPERAAAGRLQADHVRRDGAVPDDRHGLRLRGARCSRCPVILYQLYAFVLPAFSPNERRVALPLLLMVPVLFAAGVAFGYFVVLDRAVDFLLNFNESQFNIQVRARDYYSFVALMLLAMGLMFQVPMAILAVTRLGIVTPAPAARSGVATLISSCVVVAALLPTVDPVSMMHRDGAARDPVRVEYRPGVAARPTSGERAPAEPSAEGSP